MRYRRGLGAKLSSGKKRHRTVALVLAQQGELSWDSIWEPSVAFVDGEENGDETGVDCGGSCDACETTVGDAGCAD